MGEKKRKREENKRKSLLFPKLEVVLFLSPNQTIERKFLSFSFLSLGSKQSRLDKDHKPGALPS